MNYELAKKLKDAGFPQTGRRRAMRPTEKEGEFDYAEIPTLEELIDACGERFGSLNRTTNSEMKELWIGVGFKDGADCSGSTPTEAVAHLWLALNVPTP